MRRCEASWSSSSPDANPCLRLSRDDIAEADELSRNDEAMVVLQPGVARDERYLCALRGVERELALVQEANAAGQVEVLALAGAQYDVHLLAVAQQIGHVGKAREDVALALDGAFEVPEVPTVALRPRVRGRGDVADGELRRLVTRRSIRG